jgi:hypothetical protein
MDDDYYRYPAGSPEHYAAYEKNFIATGGIGAVVPGDPQASYEVENAYELAAARYDAYQEYLDGAAGWWGALGVQVAEDLLDDPESWLGEDWWQTLTAEDHSEPDIDLEAF